MQFIQPMLNAIRNNDFAAMYKYEDIMINLDELMQNHKQNTAYEGRIKLAMKERQNTVIHKKKELVEGLSLEIAAIGIFDSLTSKEIFEETKKVIELAPIDTDENIIKAQIIPLLIELNQKEKEKTEKLIKSSKVLPLLDLRDKAIKQKNHPYVLMKESNYIKNTMSEFYS